MRPEVEQKVLERLAAVVREPTRGFEARTTLLDVRRYIDLDELSREQERLFRGRPVIIAHTGELSRTRSFVTEEVGGVPLVVLRDDAGDLRVFVNACRHRGARLLDGAAGQCKKALTCRYHAWSYRLDGSLMHVPNEEAFASLDRSALALRPVPFTVRHGFVWAVVDGRGAPDMARGLGRSWTTTSLRLASPNTWWPGESRR